MMKGFQIEEKKKENYRTLGDRGRNLYKGGFPSTLAKRKLSASLFSLLCIILAQMTVCTS